MPYPLIALSGYQRCRAHGARNRQPRGEPQDGAKAGDKRFLDSMPSPRVLGFRGGQPGSLGFNLRPHRQIHMEIVESPFEIPLENDAEDCRRAFRPSRNCYRSCETTGSNLSEQHSRRHEHHNALVSSYYLIRAIDHEVVHQRILRLQRQPELLPHRRDED